MTGGSRHYGDNPGPTYRGFRLQALYTLSRILESGENWIFQPEGIEDLAIRLGNGDLTEIVQVKAHTAPLTASSFNKAFYDRVAEYTRDTPDVPVIIATYGPVGSQFGRAVREGDDEAVEQLADYVSRIVGDEESARRIIASLRIDSLCEDEVRQRTIRKLGGLCTATAPEDALEFLCWWLYTSAEGRTPLGREAVVQKIAGVGESLAKKAAYAKEWFRTIRPLVAGGPSSGGPEPLAEEFASGVAARFEHIVAGVDVRRDALLARVHESVSKHSITVVRGASGQGKSTLGYRYAHDFFPQEWRFLVDLIESPSHARDIALALAGHASATAARTLVLVDVMPGSTSWIELARSLAQNRTLKLLVMVREEDWRRGFAQMGDISYGNIELTLQEEEAKAIYDGMSALHDIPDLLDFQDAWGAFGARGALLEFVYFLHHNDTLGARLKSQVSQLEDAVRGGACQPQEIDFLRLIAVATEYGASVDLRGLAEITGVPEPKRVAEAFEREYFLRLTQGGRYAVSLHPIRSGILARLLTDNAFSPWTETVARVLPAVREGDLQWLLLSAFHHRPESSPQILEALHQFQPATWTGLSGCVRAVLWLGVREYVDENRAVIDEAFSVHGTGWRFMLNYDIAGVGAIRPSEMYSSFGFDGAQRAAEAAAGFEAKQTDCDRVFHHFRAFMESRQKEPSTPTATGDWRALGEVCFWLGHLNAESCLRSLPPAELLKGIMTEESIEAVGEACIGASALWDQGYREWYLAHEDLLKKKLRRAIRAVSLVEKDDTATAVFILSTEELALLEQDDTLAVGPAVSLNSLVMDRLHIIRNIIPLKQKYGCRGIGHHTPLIDLPYDESVKEGVLRESILPRWAPELNSTYAQLAELELHPASWELFVTETLRLRDEALDICASAQDSILAHYAEERGVNVFREHIEGDRWDQLIRDSFRIAFLPRCGVDEWGLATAKDMGAPSPAGPHHARMRQHRAKGYKKAADEYSRTLGNFLRQAVPVFVRNTAIGKAQGIPDRRRVESLLAQQGFSGEGQHLTMVNLADFCKAIPQFIEETECLLAEQIPQDQHMQLSRRELHDFPRLCLLWREFLERPDYTRVRHAREKSLARLRGLDPETELKHLRGRVNSALKRASTSGITLRVFETDTRWESEPVLWILCDATDPSRLLDASRVTQACLHKALGSVRENTAHRFLVDFFWPKIVAVPLLAGKSLRKMAYPFLQVSLLVGSQGANNDYQHIPLPIEEGTWQATGLQQWESHQIAKVQGFCDAVTKLYGLCSHYVDFRRAEPDMDDLGTEIALEYIRETQGAMSEALQDTLGRLVVLLQEYDEVEDGELEGKGVLYEALKLLIDIGNVLKLGSSPEGRTSMGLEELSEWHAELGDALAWCGLAELLWSANDLDIPCDVNLLGDTIARLGT
ncbi:MAG: hypothetical protein HN341_05025, partial [Verrucomicrobia bacterium]|nr:hypothetical protein [Verrucomicrobiota bacterium]